MCQLSKCKSSYAVLQVLSRGYIPLPDPSLHRVILYRTSDDQVSPFLFCSCCYTTKGCYITPTCLTYKNNICPSGNCIKRQRRRGWFWSGCPLLPHPPWRVGDPPCLFAAVSSCSEASASSGVWLRQRLTFSRSSSGELHFGHA